MIQFDLAKTSFKASKNDILYVNAIGRIETLLFAHAYIIYDIEIITI